MDSPEVTMSTQISTEQATRISSAPVVDMKLEVIVIPVSDVERAKRFYQGLKWRLDGDFVGNDFRIVQLTPPGSQCSIMFGKGLSTAVPGSLQGLMLIVYDVEAARTELMRNGAEVSDVFHFAGPIHTSGTEGREPGPDPKGLSYRTYASFSDPDGNGWLVQEIKTRLPGRIAPGPTDITDATSLTELLRETEQHHGEYEATAPKHHWSEWYAAYIVAREHGRTPDQAKRDAALHVERAHG
jgi:catechol 2,3-dioxygenase-like lactoylglutathione lyase family enzyme